jgi:hypothetical protein
MMIAQIETGRHHQVLFLFFALNTDSAMPQRPEERLVPDSDVPNPVTPTKPGLSRQVACQNIGLVRRKRPQTGIAFEKEGAQI